MKLLQGESLKIWTEQLLKINQYKVVGSNVTANWSGVPEAHKTW